MMKHILNILAFLILFPTLVFAQYTGPTLSPNTVDVSGDGSTSFGKDEDAVHTSGDTGVFILGVAGDGTTAKVGALGDYTPLITDINGRLIVTLGTLIAGEDVTNDRLKVEQRFSYTRVTADGQIKASAGFVHTVCVMPTTAAPTAGLITLYDNTAESGTVIYSKWFFATDSGKCDAIDATASTGLYVGYDGTLANASVTVTYR